MSKRLLTFITTLLLLTAFSVAQATPAVLGSATTTTTIAPAPAPTTQIIMSDGRICNPRWGC